MQSWVGGAYLYLQRSAGKVRDPSEASLVYITISRPDRGTQQNLSDTKQKHKHRFLMSELKSFTH